MSLNLVRELGAYQIAALIGQGGMGEVYRARDTRLNRDVAIKVLPAQFATDTDLRARFEREARTISSLNIRISARCTTSASTTASRFSSCSISKARRSSSG